MGAELQVQKFEEWSKAKGRSTRGVDRRRVALELLELSGGARVEDTHVDALIKRYRDGLMGANSILHARTVAEDLMTWQADAGLDEAGARAPAGPSEPPAPRKAIPPRSAERLERSEPPPPRQAPGAHARSERPPAWQDAALGRHESTSLVRSERPPRSSERPRASEPPGFGRSVLAESNPPDLRSRKASERPAAKGLGSLDSLPPVPPAASDLFDDLDGFSATDRPPSSRPPGRRLSTPSAQARPLSERPLGRLSTPPGSARPPRGAPADDFDDVVDRASRAFKQGFDRPPSMRPSTGLGVEASEEGVERGRGARRSDELTESVAPPPRTVTPAKVPIYTPTEEPKPLSRRLMVWGGVALPFVALIGFALSRPGCSPFADTKKSVAGTLRSKHLGVEVTFSDQWLQDETKDDVESKDGWDRRVSVFYRGTSSTDFLSQFVLVVFSRSDMRASTTEANQLGANETMGLALSRSCAPFKHPSGDIGTICSGFTARGMQRLALIEAYFPLQGRAVFARFLLEVPMAFGPAQPMGPGPGPGGENGPADEMQAVLARKVEDATLVFSSIRPLR